MYLNSLQEHLQTIQSPRIKWGSLVFRQIYGDLFECRYEYLEEECGRAYNMNPYLHASVTGWVRVILYKKMRETTAAYCDTDSVVCLHKPSIHSEKWPDEGSAIGYWGDELGPFLDVALAPKCYCLVFDKRNKKGEEYTINSKGVTMTHEKHIHILRELSSSIEQSTASQVPITFGILRLHAPGTSS
jgi:hypothetical protein